MGVVLTASIKIVNDNNDDNAYLTDNFKAKLYNHNLYDFDIIPLYH